MSRDRRIDTRLDPEALSRPEAAVFRGQSRAIVRTIVCAGGCYFCLRRDPKSEGWGRALCGKIIRAEFMKEGCTFEPDTERIEEIET
jgi:hypothetical protein